MTGGNEIGIDRERERDKLHDQERDQFFFLFSPKEKKNESHWISGFKNK